jgi:radical SAM superfamily enzyme YgiQ (UPF0313 family)
MRGKNISTPIEDLVTQAKGLAAKGVKELMLIAQDLTYYGLDLYKKRALADLINQLADVEGIEWIRLHYAFPAGFPMDVLDVMQERSNVCNYLDIPLQHGSTKILQSMRRGITREKTEELIAQIREKVPGIAIRTTLIAGYPGESEEDFQKTVDFVEEYHDYQKEAERMLRDLTFFYCYLDRRKIHYIRDITEGFFAGSFMFDARNDKDFFDKLRIFDDSNPNVINILEKHLNKIIRKK